MTQLHILTSLITLIVSLVIVCILHFVTKTIHMHSFKKGATLYNNCIDIMTIAKHINDVITFNAPSVIILLLLQGNKAELQKGLRRSDELMNCKNSYYYRYM